MRNLFRLNFKNPHPPCVMYEGICACEESYTGETKLNVEIRWGEHSEINKVSEPSRHLKRNPTHVFSWKVLMAAPLNDCVRKDL